MGNPEGNAICEICQTPKPEPQKPGEPKSKAQRTPLGPSCNADSKGVLPLGWNFDEDPASGKTYYWQDSNPSGTTTWKRPSPPAPPAPIKPAASKPSSSGLSVFMGSDSPRQPLKRNNSGGSI